MKKTPLRRLKATTADSAAHRPICAGAVRTSESSTVSSGFPQMGSHPLCRTSTAIPGIPAPPMSLCNGIVTTERR